MQLLTNIFLLAHQLSLLSALRVQDNGLGLAAYGAKENVVDYALLAADKKALPSQVQKLLLLLIFPQENLIFHKFGS